MPGLVLRHARRAGLRQALGVLAAAVLPLAAQAADTLRVIAWPGYADADIVKVFEKRHQVSVQVTVVGSDETLWQKVSGNGGADFDVFAVNTAELKRYVDQGLSVPLSLDHIPNTGQQLPRFRERAAIPNLVRDGKVYAVPYTYSEMGLIYDRKQFSEPPASISALWDPRLKGRVLAFDTGGHNFSIAALALGKPNPFQLDEDGFKEAATHLFALRRNVLTFYSLPEESVELFRDHRVALMFANYGTQQVQQLKKAGADIGYVIPKEGAFAWLDCWTVTRGAKNKALAEAWIDYMLEKPVSRALTERQGLANTIESSAADARPSRIIWLEPMENADRRSAMWARIVSGDRPVATGAR
ncbi:MAG TPA: extracellular solute-binding protein [Albitalea sp.]|jgi:putative spermidine/putrescine transport system substrate-binding protein|nr:extracellular solute-binding protein [Albitalea sp.]